ncbi:uncharacterized protein PAC_12730 [Phialocephala subalpina]|uniref:Uncharacterized protein n=1 Tax=Phialocephala subalpina TaxID=576137 RepID=A0A1L7XCU1_9HELO|nr:uncharacterized protein PAC_12730 [Phialocephala subalpina]
MVLLTSSQVSVAISTFIVFFFTTALFLAGYVLQQQTVRDIRAVIKPQLVRAPPQGPELFLPPQFREDGYLVDVIVDPVLPPKDRQEREGTNVEVKITKEEQLNDAAEEEGSGKENIDEDMIGATRWQKAARKKQLEELESQQDGSQKPMTDEKMRATSDDNNQSSEAQKEEEKLSRAERRRRIKEQILADGEGESFKGYRRRMW